MAEYVLFTESTADLTAELVQQLGVEVLPMLFPLTARNTTTTPTTGSWTPMPFTTRCAPAA